MRLLNPQQEALLKDERGLMNDLRAALVAFDHESGDQEALRQSIHQLDELFLLVAVGEFNSGKSTVINALLGEKLLEEGVTPTTTEIQILHYGETQGRTVVNDRQSVLTFPVEFLKDMSIVDTPGTNAIVREHETLTSQFVPRSDLVLFITSADRPFTESEKLFLQHISAWGKKVVFVVNKIDILQTDDEIFQVQNFVRENARGVLGSIPETFLVSARHALRAKTGEPALWEVSRFERFERYIHDTLDESSRLRLKLLNPLGVGAHLVGKYLEVITSRLEFLKTDFDLLSDVESQLDLYEKDMQQSFNLRMAGVENILLEMEQRGQVFFEDTFRLARVFDLMSKTRIQHDFERQVVADVPQRIEQKVGELIDWLVASDFRQWEAVTEHLSGRAREHQDRIVGDVGLGKFRYDREKLIDAIGREARQVIETYDKNGEAKAIAESAQTAIAASAAMEAGALGLGALITTLATTAAADVTGVLMASVVAALGLFIIPARRRQGKMKMLEKIGLVRTNLVKTLRAQFEKEIHRSVQHINEAIAPYTRFIRTESDKWLQTQANLGRLRNEMDQLKGRLERIQ
jgi:small GTP-binding protein